MTRARPLFSAGAQSIPEGRDILDQAGVSGAPERGRWGEARLERRGEGEGVREWEGSGQQERGSSSRAP